VRLRRQRHIEEEQAGIDLAPMLDFVLNLLIFFIVTAVFIKEMGMNVSKPGAASAEKKASEAIVVAIRPGDVIWVDRRQVDLRAVRASIERLHAQKPTAPVVIIPDREVASGVWVEVMDQVRLGGVQNISLATGNTGS
jgi:biopolymer transport protein ExbD